MTEEDLWIQSQLCLHLDHEFMKNACKTMHFKTQILPNNWQWNVKFFRPKYVGYLKVYCLQVFSSILVWKLMVRMGWEMPQLVPMGNRVKGNLSLILKATKIKFHSTLKNPWVNFHFIRNISSPISWLCCLWTSPQSNDRYFPFFGYRINMLWLSNRELKYRHGTYNNYL